MLVTPVCLFEGTLLPNAASATPGLYVSPANTRTVIKSCSITNTDSVARVFTFHIVPSGGSASAANMIAKTEPVGPGATYPVHQAVGQVLETGDFITAFADVASVMAARCSGVKVS